MFSANYKFKINPAKQTIRLKPTMGTYAKAFGPLVVFYGVFFIVGSVLEKRADRELIAEHMDHSDNE